MDMERKQITPEMQEMLERPLPPNAVKPHPTKSYLSHIKPIYVTERLNEVFGVGCWTVKTKLIPINGMDAIVEQGKRTEYTVTCQTWLEIPEYGIYYDCIASSTNDDIGDSAKGAATDAINKIASYMGIGADIYKGEYDWLRACRIHVARCKTETSLRAFYEDNRFSNEFVALEKDSEQVKAQKERAKTEFNNLIAKRREELAS